MKYTEGNWKVKQPVRLTDGVGNIQHKSEVVCNELLSIDIWGYKSLSREEMEANTRLIVAAPRMYEALKELLAVIKDEPRAVFVKKDILINAQAVVLMLEQGEDGAFEDTKKMIAAFVNHPDHP